MRAAAQPRSEPEAEPWSPTPDPEGRYSSGIPDFDRLLGGGFQRGSLALLSVDETVTLEDLDRITAPTLLNFLYQSRGILAVLPSRDSPHGFRARLTRYATRRRFDSRVRIVDYIGEDHGLSYVVNIEGVDLESAPPAVKRKNRERAIAKMLEAEKAVQGGRQNPYLEYHAFEVFDTLLGAEKAVRMFYQGIKRVRMMGNLGMGVLGPGLGCAAGVRRMADTEFTLHRDDVGLIIRGVRPAFPACVVTEDPRAGAPHVAFIPKPI
jgi:hypothetical protein